ncbi:hypothetical protein PBY51_016223 [Eleginops maclovinus]|uniref:Synaptopodin n=1 Tax=Eleginops maclovinus TaxID=56733 RepID=A0AAN7XPR8_ELEMC|nr:hypothetical protein PBY51_016223 [Eleginops maclovinus]
MEMDKGHTSIRRGVSWSPGGLRKPLQATQNTPGTECNASWDTTGFNKEQMSRKTNLTRSASLSEKELKEARVRSQIIAAQLTVPSNSSSRGVQLFNRRKQRVSAFTLESCGEGSAGDGPENVKTDTSTNKITWAEKSTEEKDRDLNFKNSKPLLSPPGRVHSVGDIMEEPGKDFYKEDNMEDSVIQERHFLPVKEEQEEEEEATDKLAEELEDKVKDEIPPGSNNTDPVVMRQAECEAEINEGHTGPAPPGKLHNGCRSASGPERVSVPTTKQTNTTTNRTARPFFSPLTVQSPKSSSPVMDIPPPPSYDTPPLPVYTAPQPSAFSPLPPPPSYPTPPLPAFTNQPPPNYYSSPALMSPVLSPPPPQFPVSSVAQFPPMPHYGPPKVPKPSTFVPQPAREKAKTPIKTGILEEGAARRGNRKSMFTFKEKIVVAPNPELLSLVQGVDERKKHGHKSMPEPASEEELLALGAEASNFLAKDEDRAEEEIAPEWASCLKASSTRPRAEHVPDHSLTNVSGKGAELFAKRQSRMEKYVIEKQNLGQMRSPSPTMSLPPSWVYPANMPGRVRAIAKNSDMGAELSEKLKAQQAVQQKPRQKAPEPEPIPEPPLENGCSKIEMDLSRHRPYQLSSSLFIFNPVKDPLSTLPKAAPQSKNLISNQPFSRQTSLPHNPPSHFHTQSMSPQLPLSPTRREAEYPPNPSYGQPRISSPMSAFSPERVSSPRSGVQAPRPMFSAKKAGIAPQTPKDSSPVETRIQTPTPSRTPSLTRRFSSPEGPTPGTWAPSLQTNRPSTAVSSGSVTSPMPVPNDKPVSTVFHCILYVQTNPNIYSCITTLSSLGVKVPVPYDEPKYNFPCSYFQTLPSIYSYIPTLPSLGFRVPVPHDSRCMSPIVDNPDSKANHRLLAKNIINAAKRKNSPSPRALSGHSLPISPLGNSHHGYDCNKPPISPFQSRAFGAQSPTFTSPPPTPSQRICSPVRLYNTRSLTDSDASVESEDSGLRSHSYNTCPRGWGGSLRVKRGTVSTDL